MRRILRYGMAVTAFIAISLVLLQFGALSGAAASFAESPAQATASPRPPSPCVPVFSKYAWPQDVELGDTVGITMTFRSECPPGEFPSHVALVLDASGSMVGYPNRELKAFARQFVAEMRLGANPDVSIGVVEFDNTARTTCELTNDARKLDDCIEGVGARGTGRLDLGIDEGRQLLERGQAESQDITEVLVVVSDGGGGAGCDAALEAARRARGHGMLVASACVGKNCIDECMRQVASSPRYYCETRDSSSCDRLIGNLYGGVASAALRIEITDVLSDGVSYTAGSAMPSPTEPDNPTTWLRWDAMVTSETMTFSFQVRPTRTGRFATNTEARGTLTDLKWRERDWYFSIPIINVRPRSTELPPPTGVPSITPTPTITPPPLKDPQEIGNRCIDSEIWKYLSRQQVLQGTLATRDDVDWYEVEDLQPGKTFFVEMIPPVDSDFDLEIVEIVADRGCRLHGAVDQGNTPGAGLTERVGPVTVDDGVRYVACVIPSNATGDYDPHQYYQLRLDTELVGSVAQAYLPIAVKNRQLAAYGADIVIVLDTSESMLEETGDGATKLGAAQDAIGVLLGVLRDHDQVGIVIYGDKAELRQPLTTDRRILMAELGRLRTSQGSRLDEGIRLGHEALMSRDRSLRNMPSIIVLTDGRMDSGLHRGAVEAADNAKSHGIVLFTVAVGNEVSIDVLQAIASDPDYLYVVPETGGLAGSLRDVAARLRALGQLQQ